MDVNKYNAYIEILNSELIAALGCTEPIAIALASAKAREVLGAFPSKLEIACSGNVIKNVKSVTVPNSGGLKGVEAAAILGALAGNASDNLEVLSKVTEEDRAKTHSLLEQDFAYCNLIENVDNLYIIVRAISGDEYAEVTIINRHSAIARIVKNGEVLLDTKKESSKKSCSELKQLLSIKDIIEFASCVNIDDIKDVIGNQIALNTTISNYGLNNKVGENVGSTILKCNPNDVQNRARAKASAGSDARMGGCALPVVINSGSGNQGLTVSLPVIEYANHLNVGDEKLYRALAISNLISIHLKKYIGSLSAFCGAVTAGCGSGAAITYLYGGSFEQICNTITNMINNVGGIVCDGAKSSCAAKIASSIDAAILAHEMSMNGHVFHQGDGLVQGDIEATIKSIGYLGRVGMKTTDTEILKIMTNKVVF